MIGLIPCVAMPDEPAWGQFLRMAQENGLYGRRALLKLLPEKASKDRWGVARRQWAFLMAGISRPSGNRTFDLLDYFKQHCTFTQLVELPGWVNCWGKLVYRWAFHHGTHYPSPLVVRSCPECAKADVCKVGFAWYKQGHQLPGIEWCQEHRCSLFQVPAERDLVQQAEGLSHQAPRDAGGSDPMPHFVDRYIHALDWLRRPGHASASSQFAWQVNRQIFGINLANYWQRAAFRHSAEFAAPRDWYFRNFVEPRLTLSRPMKLWKATAYAERALVAAHATSSVEELTTLISKVEGRLREHREEHRRWRESGGVGAIPKLQCHESDVETWEPEVPDVF